MQNRPHFRFFAANVDVQEVTEQALRQEWGSLDLNAVWLKIWMRQLLTSVNMAHNIQKVS